MRYLFQRIAHNYNRWQGPSSGRLGTDIDGDSYVRDTGFAHEDWNFKREVCADGYLYGYVYYQPKNLGGEFNILFATYDRGEGWALAGYYEHATYFEDGADFPRALRATRASELEAIGPLGGDYTNANRAQIAKLLRKDAQSYRWRVRPTNVHLLQSPVHLPPHVADVRAYYFARPKELTREEYERVVKYVGEYRDRPPADNYVDGGEIEFPEGNLKQRTHFARERNPQIVAEAKRRFKKTHGHLFCEACDFDYHATYGSAGEDFIEVHHLKPVSEMRHGETTRLEDVALVCSNCHRVLHRRRPWLSIEALKKLLKKPI